jgi:hypothetical protein
VLGWAPPQPRHLNRTRPGLLPMCARAAGAGGTVEPPAGGVVAQAPRLPGAPPGGNRRGRRQPTSVPGRRAGGGVLQRAPAAAPRRARRPMPQRRLIGPRGRACFPGSRRPQCAAGSARGQRASALPVASGATSAAAQPSRSRAGRLTSGPTQRVCGRLGRRERGGWRSAARPGPAGLDLGEPRGHVAAPLRHLRQVAAEGLALCAEGGALADQAPAEPGEGGVVALGQAGDGARVPGLGLPHERVRGRLVTGPWCHAPGHPASIAMPR